MLRTSEVKAHGAPRSSQSALAGTPRCDFREAVARRRRVPPLQNGRATCVVRLDVTLCVRLTPRDPCG